MSISVLNSEKPSFGVKPGVHSHTACIEQVQKADILLLIIGARHGGTFLGSENSITNEEYNAAAKLGVPRIVCVKKNVLDIMPTWKKNPRMDLSGVVDDERVFLFVDYIRSEATDNWLFPFETIDDIKTVLLSQFAYYLHLFSQQQRTATQKEKTVQLSELAYVAFPSQTEGIGDGLNAEEQTSFRNELRLLHALLVSILTSEMKNGAKLESMKTLWLLAKYGNWDRSALELDSDVFKGYAWSTTRGVRVFAQLQQFGVNCKYYQREDGKLWIEMRFQDESDDASLSWALEKYVCDLDAKYGKDALQFFMKADMRIYMG